MRAGRRSQTAEATAFLRALHQLLDDEPKVLDDRYAAVLLPPGLRFLLWRLQRSRARLRQGLPGRVAFWSPTRASTGVRRMRAQVVVRSRWAEDRLQLAMHRGVDQFVLLGAGLDSFSLRRDGLRGDLRIFEVDHPASQSAKIRRLRATGRPWPGHLELVPCDFEKQSLSEVLTQSPLDATKPVFFSWLGVSYYLSLEAIRNTLELVASFASGSEIVLDHWSDLASNEPVVDADADTIDEVRFDRRLADIALLESTRLAVAAQGEPMVSFFGAAGVREIAGSCGLEVADSLSPRAATRSYLQDRRDGLRMPLFAHLTALRTP